MIKMRVEFYLVTEYDVANTAITRELVQLAGGASVLPNVAGVWLNRDGEAVYDSVCILQAFMDDSPENRMYLESLALKYKEDAEQDCVLYVINTNEMYYV